MKRKFLKSAISFIMACVIIVGMLPLSAISAFAASDTISGPCGDNTFWEYNISTSTLTFSGVGTVDSDVFVDFYLSNFSQEDFSNTANNAFPVVDTIVIKAGISSFEGSWNITDFLSGFEPQEIMVDNDNQYFSSLEGVLFNKEKTVLIFYSRVKRDSHYTVPEGVITIGEEAFAASDFQYISIPDTVQEIRQNAFWGAQLRSLFLPSSLVDFDITSVFWCDNLVSISVDEHNPKYTSYNGVLYDKNMKILLRCPEGKTGEIIVPEGVEKIGTRDSGTAFVNCSYITKIYIPSSVIEIYNPIDFGGKNVGYADRDYDRLKAFEVSRDNKFYASYDGILYNKTFDTLIVCPKGKSGKADLADCVTVIEEFAFSNCCLTNIIIPSSVIEIKDNAFLGSGLEEIDISEGVKIIGSATFYGCDNLKEIKFPSSVESIGSQAFDGIEGLESVWFYNPNCYIHEGNYSFNPSLIVYGYPNSTAETFANNKGLSFYSLDTYSDYYAETGSYAIVARDKNGMAVYDYTITVNGIDYPSDGHTTYIDIPSDYTGNITVSKAGYITNSLPASQLKKYNFFVMYESSENRPIVQQLLLRNTKNAQNAYTDLLRSYEYIYDFGNTKHDLYVDVNSNGFNITKIYLQQGKNTITLQNGMNYNLNTNGVFNSEYGTIYFCIQTSDGTVYKTNSRIVTLDEKIELKIKEDDIADAFVDDSIDALGGQQFKAKWNFGSMPVSLTINENGKVKGTIGIQGDEKFTNTWYDEIQQTIKKHSSSGNTEYSSLEMAQLDTYIKNNGGRTISTSSSFGIDVDAKIIGYIEAQWNSEECKLESIEIGALLSVGGSVSYTQQSVALVAAVPIPYYWSVKLKAELETKVGITWDLGTSQCDINMPAVTATIGISGDLCIGINKVVGGGARLAGELKMKFAGPDYNFKSSVWTLSADFYIIGQIAGFEGSFTPYDMDHLAEVQLYPVNESKNSKTNISATSSPMTDFSKNSKVLANAYSTIWSTFSANQNAGNAVHTFKQNGYAFASPTVATLSNGTAVMVWLDYDNTRSDVNKTALYYSVYSPFSEEWSTPQQVENDGTPDDIPLLKKLDNKIYLVWNNCSKILPNNATVSDLLANMDISFAEFDGAGFKNITTFEDDANVMDVAADITTVNGNPVVVWIRNTANDLFCKDGTNSIMMASYNGKSWNSSIVKNNVNAINSVAVCEENGETAVYYSGDVDGDIFTTDDYEIFRIDGNGIQQITDNTVSDVAIVSVGNKVYWKGQDYITDGNAVIDCPGIIGNFSVVNDLYGNPIILYYTEDSAGNTTYYACKGDAYGIYGSPIKIADGEYMSGGFTAYCDSQALWFASNEVSTDYSSKINIYNIHFEEAITIDDAFYENYTLIKGGTLRTYVTVSNNGFDNVNGYTIYAYNGDELLYEKTYNTVLLSGESETSKFIISLPDNMDFDEIQLYVTKRYAANTKQNEYSLKLSTLDVSVENAMFFTDKITASIINRGIDDITKPFTVYLRKDAEDGEIIDSIKIDSLASGMEEIAEFAIGNTYDKRTKFYITVDFMDGESYISNNSDFTVISDITAEEYFVENAFTDYDKIELDEVKSVSIESAGSSVMLLFTPDEDGYYAFYSTSDSDTYGYILDAGMNELASDDDSGDGNNFKVKCYLQAGETYILQAHYYNSNQTGIFEVCIEKTKYVTDISIVSLPYRLEYIRGYAYQALNYDGLKLSLTWSDGSTTEWAYGYDNEIDGEWIHFDDYDADAGGIIYVSYGDQQVSFEISLIDNPVEHIEVVNPSDIQPLIENTEGYWVNYTETPYYYYYTPDLSDVLMRIYYTDGTNKTVSLNKGADGYGFDWSDDQYNKHWTLGSDNYIEISYLGKTTYLPITIIENPVDYITIDSAPTREYVYGDTEYGYGGVGYYEFWPNDLTGLVFTVYHKNGTSKTYTSDDIVEWYIDGYPFDLEYDGFNPELGMFPVTLTYMGKSAEYTVLLKESTVASIAVTKQPTRTSYTNDYSPDFVGMEITITYTDGTTKAVTLTEDNVIVEYLHYSAYPLYKVNIDGYYLTIEEYNDFVKDDRLFSAYYLGKSCEISGIFFTESKEISSIELSNVTWNGDGMTVKIKYTDETTETLTIDIAAYRDRESTVAGYGKTENGLLFYLIETYTDEVGNVEKYEVAIFGKEIVVEVAGVIVGDVNGDGEVNNKDVTMLRRYLVGGWNVTIDGMAADVNGDGEVNNKDVTMLRRYLVGGWNVALG